MVARKRKRNIASSKDFKFPTLETEISNVGFGLTTLETGISSVGLRRRFRGKLMGNVPVIAF